MPITKETLRLFEEYDRQEAEFVNDLVRNLVADWDRSWQSISSVWERFAEEMSDLEEWPAASRLTAEPRLRDALSVTQRALSTRAEQGATLLANAVPDAVRSASSAQAGLIASGMPGSFNESSNIREMANPQDFRKVSEQTLTELIEDSRSRIADLMGDIPATTYANIVTSMVQGPTIVPGINPVAVARRILEMAEATFLGGLASAARITRTEMLDAMRKAQQEQDRANSDVLGGWRWTAELNVRTCPSCFSMDGKVFSIAIPGPMDHVQGRCARVPITKSWRDLGIDIDDPEDPFPNAEDWFGSLSHSDKLEIMGPGRLTLLERGDIGWSDLSQFTANPSWRGSYNPTPLSVLKQRAAK